MKENKYVYKEAKTSFGQIDKRQHELVTHVEFNKYINEFLTQGNHQDDALVEMYGVASEHETRLETAEDTLVNHTKQLVNHEMRVTKAEGTLVTHDNRITHNTNMNNAQDEVINNLNERLKVVEDNNADFKVVTVFANNVQKVETFVAQAGQRNFRLNLASYIPGQNRLAVYVNGVQQTINDGFVEVDSRTFQFTEGLAEGMKVTAHYFTEETSDDLTDIMETIKEGPAILEGLITNGESRVNEFIQSGETTINGFLSEGEREVEELVTKGESAFDTLVQKAEQVKADSILVQPTKPKPSDNCDIWFDTSEDDFLILQDYEEARNQAFNNQMATFESRFSEIKGEKGDKGEPGVGVLESDFKDYMGDVHETLREVHKSNVEYTVRTAVGEFNHLDYEGQHITANHSIEGHVKSAMLKGQTLVNLSKVTYGTISINANGHRQILYAPYSYNLKTNTKYYVMFQVRNLVTDGKAILNYSLSGGQMSDGSIENVNNGYYDFIITTRENLQDHLSSFAIYFTAMVNSEASCDIANIMIIEYQEGMENWDIPYFTGMQSVKMPVLKTTGKNLFDGELIDGYYDASLDKLIGDKTVYRSIKVYLKRGTYTLSFDQSVRLVREIKDGVYYHAGNDYLNYTFTTETDGLYGLSFRKTDHTTFDLVNIQLEANSTATSYEPFKSNILTVNEPVELRGIGEVKDELNLLTGELTERIGEIVFDGSENWETNDTTTTNTVRYYLNGAVKNAKPISEDGGVCDKIPYGRIHGVDEVGVTLTKASGHCYLRSTIRDLSEFKTWLQSNPITVQYRLATESVKTVDLSDNVVYSYDEVTHYDGSSESGSLIPTVAVKVPTDVQAVITDQSATIQTLEQENQVLKKTQDTLLVVQLGMMEQMATNLSESEEQPTYLKALRQLASERGLL